MVIHASVLVAGEDISWEEFNSRIEDILEIRSRSDFHLIHSRNVYNAPHNELRQDSTMQCILLERSFAERHLELICERFNVDLDADKTEKFIDLIVSTQYNFINQKNSFPTNRN